MITRATACIFLCFIFTLPVRASEQSTLAELEAKVDRLVTQQELSHSAFSEALNKVAITGYVSLRGGQLSEDGFTYLGALEDEWSFSSESTYGIQVKAPMYDNVNVLLQFSGDSLESQTEIDWAFVEYAMSSVLTLRGGRLRVPGFMMSEYREVGYTYPWVQTPLEVYGLTPFLRYEGIDLRYFMSVGELDIRFNPFIGSTRNQDLSVGKVKYAEQNSQFRGIDVQFNYRSFAARFSHSVYNFDLVNVEWDTSMSALIDGVTVVPGDSPVRISGLRDVIDSMVNTAIPEAQAGIQLQIDAGAIDPAVGAGIIAAYDAEAVSLSAQKAGYVNDSIMGGSQSAEYTSVGVSYDSENWLMLAELIRGKIGGAFPDADGGYMTVGYRIGNWMPHLTYASIKSADDDERRALPEIQVTEALWTGELSKAVAGARTLITIVNGSRNLSSPEQRSWTLGLRWDPKPGIAVKAEYSRTELPGDSYGYILPQAVVDGSGEGVGGVGFQEKVDDVDIVKVSLDLVF